jgi:hypothetical protein
LNPLNAEAGRKHKEPCMKIEDIGRTVIAVKPLDTAAAFLSRLLGNSFEEVTGPMV